MIRSRNEFRAGHEARIDPAACTGCGWCLSRCRFGAIQWANTTGGVAYSVDPLACEGCGVCVDTCPVNAIAFPERVSGEWYISDTRCGPMVHARLGVASENSGKLVSMVRQQARNLGEEQGKDLIIIDGPPGIGCPVIASISGASLVLIVTEPTLSGQHDLRRVAELARHFRVPGAVCINKWDLNADISKDIENGFSEMGLSMAGKVRYDCAITKAQVAGKNVLEYSTNGVVKDIKSLWNQIEVLLSL